MARAVRGATTMVQSTAPRGARSLAILTVMSGSEAGRVLCVPAADPLTVGRSDACAAVLTDSSLSRAHARFDEVMGEVVLSDLGSRNGSYVNEVRVQGPVRLREGDCVTLGRSTTMRFARVTREEAEALAGVYEASTKDGLTKLYNRRHLEESLDAEIAFCLRHDKPLSIVMLDIDHFKRVNDSFGHAAGDSVLASVAATMLRCVRVEDVVARVGGEEFLVVLRMTSLEGAATLAERLRLAIEVTPIAGPSEWIRVTASFGVASLDAVRASGSRCALMALADSRLYEAKRLGRNRVVGG